MELLRHFYNHCFNEQTDPENEDYAPEHGAVRTFQAERLAELEAERLKREQEEEEANNPMKASYHFR